VICPTNIKTLDKPGYATGIAIDTRDN